MSLKLKASALRSVNITIPAKEREVIASDLEALAWLAENMPEVFSKIPAKK